MGDVNRDLQRWNYREYLKKQQDHANWYWDQTHKKDIYDEDSAREQMRRDWVKQNEPPRYSGSSYSRESNMSVQLKGNVANNTRNNHGGVNFNKMARFISSSGNISAVAYDAKTGNLMLVGEKGLSYESFLSAEDIAVIYRAVFKSDHEGVAVTIDPDPEKLNKFGIVKFSGGVENTHVGLVLYEADRILKSLSAGYDNLTGIRMQPDVDGYRPSGTIALSMNDGSQESVWTRFWFVADAMVIEADPGGHELRFISDDVTIKTERMEWKDGRLVTSTNQSPDDPENRSSAQFAEHFNANFNRYCDVYPVLKELREIAKIVAIFKWLKERHVGDCDFSTLGDLELTKIETPMKTPIATVEYSKTVSVDQGTIIYRRIHSGGVNLYSGFKFRSVSGSGNSSAGNNAGLLFDKCRSGEDFDEFDCDGRKMIKATIIDLSGLPLFERIVLTFKRYSALLLHYYKKIIV